MIKNFETYINEDYFSKLANRKDTGEVRKENELTEDLVRSFIDNNCEQYINSITIRKENGKTVVDIDGDFYLKEDVEQIPFQFGKVTGDFDYGDAEKLTSLEGCPKEVGGIFNCSNCQNLTSLKGCPQKVGEHFDCSHCKKLTSLEGSPKEVGGGFYCYNCKKLTSLEGCPKEVGGDFSCSHCPNLTSLKGCPEKVGRVFSCEECGRRFPEEEVKSLCNVKGNIYV